MRAPIYLALAGLLLTACGADESDEIPTDIVDYSQLQPTPISTEGLVRADQDTLERHIKNGLRLQLSSGGFSPPPVSAPADQVIEGADRTGGTGGGFSETNVHVMGVDEADYAKYDGQHWYVATYPQYSSSVGSDQLPGLKVLALDPASPSTRTLGKFSFDDQWGDIGEMYLVQEQDVTSHVVTVRNRWGSVMPRLPGVPMGMAADLIIAPDIPIWPGPVNSKVLVQLLDVADPSAPYEDWGFQLDGSLIDSRKIGNTLYLITRFDPWIQELSYEYGDSGTRSDNEQKLSDLSSQDLMPRYEIGGQSAGKLTTDCYVQPGLRKTDGFSSLVHVTAIDLSEQKLVSSQCINSNIEAMSMSLDALYLTGTSYDASSKQATVIHKFDLTEAGPAYAASGLASGGLGWNSDPAFRMHEHEDQFRIVTTDWTREGPEHRLTIMRQRGSKLHPIAQLPNAENPEPIGKPGEDIFSVRFNEDLAYIVTFLRTDPLYAIDLSDPENPEVVGELEVPGFATYMHPVGDSHLFTLGQDADERGAASGIKAELIDVTSGDPQVVNTLLFGDAGSYSEALYDLRALSVLRLSDSLTRVAMPMAVHQKRSEQGFSQWDYTGLQLFEIHTPEDGKAELKDAGVIVSARNDGEAHHYSRSGLDRSVLHDDAVFYTHNNDIWTASWYSPESARGPEMIPCTAEYVYGLRVDVNLDSNADEQNACEADVVAVGLSYKEQLMVLPGESGGDTCHFYGVGERAGSYTIFASLPGFVETQTQVQVGRDECHVIPEYVDVHLTP